MYYYRGNYITTAEKQCVMLLKIQEKTKEIPCVWEAYTVAGEEKCALQTAKYSAKEHAHLCPTPHSVSCIRGGKGRVGSPGCFLVEQELQKTMKMCVCYSLHFMYILHDKEMIKNNFSFLVYYGQKGAHFLCHFLGFPFKYLSCLNGGFVVHLNTCLVAPEWLSQLNNRLLISSWFHCWS